MATQEQRRAETRHRLLVAAAELFAEHGIEATSIDAIAGRADRTSGALYDHFGSKDGLLFALLDGWVDDVAAVVGAELSASSTLEARLGVLWRNVSAPVAGSGHWIALEHELWSYAIRNPDARAHLAVRYRGAWKGIGLALSGPSDDRLDIGPAVIGVLFGLEMMRRMDPAAVPDELAIESLRKIVAPAGEPRQPVGSSSISEAQP